MEKEIFFDLIPGEKGRRCDFAGGRAARSRAKDNDEKDECAIVVVVVVVAIFVLLFSLVSCVLLGEKKWKTEKDSMKYKNILKGRVSSFHVMPLFEKGPPSSSSRFQKKKKKKENFVGFGRFFIKKIGIFCAISRFFFPVISWTHN